MGILGLNLCGAAMAIPPHKKPKLSPQSQDHDRTISETSFEDESRPSGFITGIQSKDSSRNGRRRDVSKRTMGTCNSDLMQLQVEELLSNVRPDYKRRMVKAENAIHKLKDIIQRIPARDAKSVCVLTTTSVAQH